MFRMVPAIIKWLSIPMLLIASMVSRSAASYELLVDFLICLGAMVFVQRICFVPPALNFIANTLAYLY